MLAAVRLLTAICALLAATAVAAPARAAYDPAYEQRNYSKIDERSRLEFSDPAFQQELRTRGIERQAEAERIRTTDPERDFSGNLCSRPQDGCAGDFRLYDWAAKGHGIRTSVLWTARNGSTISGHLWMTAAGPARRPAIVITNGSVQAPETAYWGEAATLAKKGYVVLTWDPQGQGLSDTYGEGADRNDGFPSQEGRPFYDGTEDALDFLFSSPERPYVPRPSCTTGTSHAAKQARRVQEGYDAAFNPLWRLVDLDRVGIAGHSLGAAAVSYVGQADPRVKAIVAYDNLREPTAPGRACGGKDRPAVPIAKPALGIANDYGLFRQPIASEPDPLEKSAASRAYGAAGVDSGELVIRGGTHYESSYIPNHYFSGTLRGLDLIAWYTGAFFDRYVKGDPGAERRLLTGRWRADDAGAKIDPAGDGNLFSGYFRSRLDVGRAGGTRAVCEDVRAGCPALVADDGAPAGYGYLA
jgi:dienelactone hydrolase